MQRQEHKVISYEKYLQRRALTDSEAAYLLKKFEAKLTTRSTVTNVVEDNYNLRKELKEAMAEITRLESLNRALNDNIQKAMFEPND